jgi:hypothetical protein
MAAGGTFAAKFVRACAGGDPSAAEEAFAALFAEARGAASDRVTTADAFRRLLGPLDEQSGGDAAGDALRASGDALRAAGDALRAACGNGHLTVATRFVAVCNDNTPPAGAADADRRSSAQAATEPRALRPCHPQYFGFVDAWESLSAACKNGHLAVVLWLLDEFQPTFAPVLKSVVFGATRAARGAGQFEVAQVLAAMTPTNPGATDPPAEHTQPADRSTELPTMLDM